MLRLRRPTSEDLAGVLERVREQRLTYAEVGATAGALPDGYHHVHADRVVGHGDEAFARGVAALRDWAPQRGSDMTVVADAPLAVGTNVALAAPLPVGFAIATCRVVQVDDEQERFGFAYGTLPDHPERGEERFELVRTDETVTFRITAFSRPQQLLTRLSGPVARAMQSRATQRYLDAMERAASP